MTPEIEKRLIDLLERIEKLHTPPPPPLTVHTFVKKEEKAIITAEIIAENYDFALEGLHIALGCFNNCTNGFRLTASRNAE